MSEIKYVVGKTVESAMAAASAQYDNEKNVSYTIVEMPKKGFLGIGATPAKIKVTYDAEDVASIFENVVSEVKGMKVSTARGSDGNAEKAKKPEKKKEVKPVENKKENKPQEKKKEAKPIEKKKENNPVAPAEPKVSKAKVVEVKEKEIVIVTPEEMACAIEFLNNLIKNMNINAKAEQDGDAKINIVGENTNVLIGYHGETLDSIQYLVNLCVCRHSETSQKEFVKIAVDVENYRAKREETLRALARRMAAKAVKNKRNVVLEPMNPYERRIIHSEIQNLENVSTHSVGSDENRKIVITYEGADKVEHSSRRHNYRHNKKSENKATEEAAVESNE